MRSDQICICMHFFDNQTWVLLHLDASSPTPLSIPMLEMLSLSNHRLCLGGRLRGAARGRRGCHWDRRQDDSELSNESFHCGIHRRLAFKKVSYFQIQKLFHNFFHAFRVSLRKLSLLLEWIRLASWSQAWDEGLCWENWLSLQWVSWLVSGRDGRRQEARISNPIKSTIEFIKSRHPDIPVNFGRAWPFLFSMKSVRVRQVQLESLRFFKISERNYTSWCWQCWAAAPARVWCWTRKRTKWESTSTAHGQLWLMVRIWDNVMLTRWWI